MQWLIGGNQHIRWWSGFLVNNRQSLVGERGAWHLMPNGIRHDSHGESVRLAPLASLWMHLPQIRVTLFAIKQVVEHIRSSEIPVYTNEEKHTWMVIDDDDEGGP